MSNPLAEVFGFVPTAGTPRAVRHRANRLCPFNNKSPNCTKDKVSDPLGVCSVRTNSHGAVITCPYRFRQDWIVLEHAANRFFGKDARWTCIPEVRLTDADGNSAGNIDFVLVEYDADGRVVDFGAIEVQAVYISGNVRNPFNAYMKRQGKDLDWQGQPNQPNPDFLSSSRKRLIPQLLSKGSIFDAWGKNTAIVLDKAFFSTLPPLAEEAPLGKLHWLVYELSDNTADDQLTLTLSMDLQTDYTQAMESFISPRAGDLKQFVSRLQKRLDALTPPSSAPETLLPKVDLG